MVGHSCASPHLKLRLESRVGRGIPNFSFLASKLRRFRQLADSLFSSSKETASGAASSPSQVSSMNDPAWRVVVPLAFFTSSRREAAMLQSCGGRGIGENAD